MSNLKPLVWCETRDSFVDGRMELTAQGAGIFYTMRQMQGYIQIDWHNQVKGAYDKNTSYKTFNEAQNFIAKKHYPHFMSEFVKPSPTWIDASERLPEEDGLYLAHYPDQPYKQKIVFFRSNINKFNLFHELITHWMPLPDAPKESNCD